MGGHDHGGGTLSMSGEPGGPIIAPLEEFYKHSDSYLQHLLTHDEAFFAPYRELCGRFIRPGSRILDLGCGTGRSALLLSRDLQAQVVGCDLSWKFLSVQESWQGASVRRVSANATALPFRDGCVDAVAAFHFIEHVPDVESVLAEMCRVVRPGGVLILVSPNLLSPFPWLRDLAWKCRGRVRRAGWTSGWASLCGSLVWSLSLSIQKLASRRVTFLFRRPQLDGAVIGEDTDSVYLANPMDLARWLRGRGFRIRRVAIGATRGGRVTAAVCPWLNGLIGLAAEKIA